LRTIWYKNIEINILLIKNASKLSVLLQDDLIVFFTLKSIAEE